jgi:uncharacterized protein
MSHIEQSQSAERHVLPDLVRAFAVIGIVLVNVAYFAYPGEVTYHDGGLKTGLDHAAYFGVNALFLFKAYTLFSFMFGAGLAYQMMSAERRGIPFGRRYFRRMLGLLLLGIAHVSVAFMGDILIVYAVLGCLLFLFRNKTVKSLMRWGIAFVIIQVLISLLLAAAFYAGETFSPEEMAASFDQMHQAFPHYHEVFGSGSFMETVIERWAGWGGFLIFALPIQGPGVLGFFLMGLAAVKSGVISNAEAPLWRKARLVYLPFGLMISLLAAYVIFTSENAMSAKAMLGMSLILIGSPFASIGYIGFLAKWAAAPKSALKTFLARGGTATLSIYLLQSLILAWVFNGYGLGLYGKIGAAGCIGIALITGLVTLIAMSLWRVQFARGPFEMILRRFTYWGRH